MEEVRISLYQLIKYLKEKPKLILKEDINLLSNYVSFFEGFFSCLKTCYGISIEREISKWYQGKVDIQAPNMNWFNHFELVNKEKSEKELINLLLDNISTFFKDNEEIWNNIAKKMKQ